MVDCSQISSLFPKCLTVFLFSFTAVNTVSNVSVFRGPGSLLLGITLSLSFYTYFKVCKVGAGSPLDFPALRISNLKAAEQGLELPPKFLTEKSVTLKRNGRYRFCRECMVWKPDRCHHCSGCNICILRMDHHCPWFAACVGFRNQRYFIHFLLYALTYSIIIFFWVGTDLLLWFRQEKYQERTINLSLLLVWILSVVVTISMAFFTGYSVYMVTANQTTIEMYESSEQRSQVSLLDEMRGTQTQLHTNVFDLGSALRNWKAIMGQAWYEWVLPIQTFVQVRNMHSLDESGLYFEVNSDLERQVSESMNLQEQLMRRLTPRSSYGNGELRPIDFAV
ncbi:LAME_0C09142g1_1 [Lachancea meyersii CBS 8951]|uniref:Palmitoyltransferase n=1 Tax=Lachancea meyersii CBS 8951 TaxID=1266667 RepID=A0A1G4J3N5_9SACH|nr:LAME_0C09142g1_1 [Lachancea meyersii CBS 8951]